ncbi:SAM-dependent methyltransferase [Longispora albida]|uniref:SAM-dependent methyltransferase n=1 Tax=Longispora albida TaxID=203523 RepID=UPI00037C0DDB|nr:class I SAM-dependent methyltransferase [Longispora albida]
MRTADTSQHYELDPEVFGLFLDPMRKYSCGIYESPSDTLAEAQVRKLHFVAGRLGLRGGERLLDIGCGWGSLPLFMAQEYKCEVTGLSPAGRQHAYIRGLAAERGLSSRVNIRSGYFETAEFGVERYDGITMLGSIVHMPDLAGVYSKARSLLRKGGMLYVSESCFRNAGMHARFDAEGGTRFVRESIYGSGEMRPLSDLVRAAEDAGLSVVAVDDLTDNYRRTIADWMTNAKARADELNAHQPGLAENMIRYFEICNAAWGYTTKHYALTCSRSR